ncbi:MAG: hypothetical protein WA657_12360 [Candidatus Acidiferrales bacterium]
MSKETTVKYSGTLGRDCGGNSASTKCGTEQHASDRASEKLKKPAEKTMKASK